MRLSHWYRSLITTTALVLSAQLGAAPPPAPEPLDHAAGRIGPEGKTLWFDAQLLHIEGMAWKDTETTYARLPARAEGKVTKPVWTGSRNTAGICVRFVTDSTTISAEWDGSADHRMAHMAQTGSAGLDLYRLKADKTWEYCGTGRPRDEKTSCVVAGNLPPTPTDYMLYLPTYHRVTTLLIGVDPKSTIAPARPRPEGRNKPIVFYGTSITQGGCASRSGMHHTAMLGRWLNREVINLGFSGAGKMEPIMAELLCEIDAQLYVLECLPNMTVEMVRERVEPFVRTLRGRRPGVPIILAENPLHPSSHEQNVALREAVRTLRAEGLQQLTLLPSGPQLQGQENGTVDGVHPTDLGFFRMARAYVPFVTKAVGTKK